MSLLTQASLIVTPNAVKASKLYSVVPSNGNGDMDVVRATTATRTNSLGLIESVASNVPRLNYEAGSPSILVEPLRTNRLLNSDIVVTQSITTAGLQMAVSFYGTGTITFSGTFVGSLVGTGANNRVSIVFTPTTGTLVLTVTGSVTKGQVETGNYATSYIPTLGTAVTRNGDLINKTGIADLIGQTEGVMFMDLNLQGISLSDGLIYPIASLSLNNSGANRLEVYRVNNNIFYDNIVGGASQFSASVFTITNFTGKIKIALSYKLNNVKVYINGSLVNTDITALIPTCNDFNLGGLRVGLNRFWGAGINTSLLFKTQLTDAECISLTTL